MPYHTAGISMYTPGTLHHLQNTKKNTIQGHGQCKYVSKHSKNVSVHENIIVQKKVQCKKEWAYKTYMSRGENANKNAQWKKGALHEKYIKINELLVQLVCRDVTDLDDGILSVLKRLKVISALAWVGSGQGENERGGGTRSALDLSALDCLRTGSRREWVGWEGRSSLECLNRMMGSSLVDLDE